jgi:hypothetical protein
MPPMLSRSRRGVAVEFLCAGYENEMTRPAESTATQNRVVGHEIATSGLASIDRARLHDRLEYRYAWPVASTATHTVATGQSTEVSRRDATLVRVHVGTPLPMDHALPEPSTATQRNPAGPRGAQERSSVVTRRLLIAPDGFHPANPSCGFPVHFAHWP